MWELEEENRKFRAVAEAVKILNERKKKGWSTEYGWSSLDRALAALEEPKQAVSVAEDDGYPD